MKQANASLSMIAYHFGDTESFVNEAVWRALVQGIPIEVDPNRADGLPLSAIDDWTELLARLIRPRQERELPGFYVGVARLIGQAALFARRRKDLLPVILHLRKIEGTGTFRASQTIWPTGLAIEKPSTPEIAVELPLPPPPPCSPFPVASAALYSRQSGVRRTRRNAA
ncbi:hypothetical protein [Novosphingobium sp. fls2-241-R2A-195]|uniref:hypothetical protein n=1 Tax=Novosphingobium sp. fls2-241-R2A-195 TaxID=3040296 RepID=UPI00254AEA63|nr:hypothetical protein [Novosphingobium sp. fls2-241-R2A-195]